MTPDSPVAPTSIAELRHARQLLKHERDHITYWRRLLRARVDLAMASILMPDELGFNAWGVLPDTATGEVPAWDELVNAVRREPWPQLAVLDECRGLDERLAAYESRIVSELNRTTNALVDLLSRDPSLGIDYS